MNVHGLHNKTYVPINVHCESKKKNTKHDSRNTEVSIKMFFFFQCCSTREDLSIDVSITNVGLMLTKLRWYLLSGYRQTDTISESSYGNMSAHKNFMSKLKNLELAVDRYMPPRMTGMRNEFWRKWCFIRAACKKTL